MCAVSDLQASDDGQRGDHPTASERVLEVSVGPRWVGLRSVNSPFRPNPW
jgi:hypothetical protein